MDRLSQMLTDYNVLGAFWMTIQLTVWGALGALILGTIITIMRVSPVAVFSKAAALYTNVILYTPLTLIAFFFAFGVYMKMQLSLAPLSEPTRVHNYLMGIVAIAVYHSSLVAESLRSGINTVPPGQAEAARAIGLDFGQSLREVILPQAFRGSIAPLGNTMIALCKNTTVVATIGVAESAFVMKEMIEMYSDLIIPIFVIMATGFVVLTLPLGLLFTWWSKKATVLR
ncbi:MAG: amino acid ABC transporter permease [Propioniciclava sp.]|uniref:amino acid ABC transporter permease n=1 Tax=Propioniciclava sp. TaxID=2038686 RepID=UPI0039E24719